MTLRVGVIGVGAMGSIHAQNIASRVPDASLEAIAEINPRRAKSIANRAGVAKVYSEASQLLADSEIDAVVISTLRDLHPDLIAAAARAGKHVFCEKPLGSTLKECDMALEAVALAGVTLQIGFHRRFDASFARAREGIVRGEIGKVRIMHMTSRDPSPVAGNAGRSPEDLFLETTIHDLDMARFLAGAEIAQVYAEGLSTTDGLEGAVVTLLMANSVVATIDNHLRSPYGYDQRLEAYGTGGVVTVENQAHTTSNEVAGSLPFFAERYADAYLAELAAFVACVSEGTEPTVTGQDGRAAVVAALAAVKSLETGRPVRLS